MAALRRYRLLDTPAEQSFDDITGLAAFICSAPAAAMSLVDSERQWFKAAVGTELRESAREHAFCAHTIQDTTTLVVEDATADARFAGSPLVTGEHKIRFYAGAPLITPEGHRIGALCVIDRRKRGISSEQKTALETLARQVMVQIELRRVSAQLAETISEVGRLGGMLPMCAYCKGVRDDAGYWQKVEAYISQLNDMDLSHGICPDCAKQHFPDIDLAGGV